MNPLRDQGNTPLLRDMRDAERTSIGRGHALADLEPRSTIVTFDDGHKAMLLSRFRLDGPDWMVAEVEGGLAEVHLPTRVNRFVPQPYCTVCLTEKRWPSELDSAGRCDTCNT